MSNVTGKTSGPPQRILVVDDAVENVRLLAGILSAEGYALHIARSGEEALKRIAEDMPNLVLLDVMMPGISGLEVCQQLRENDATKLLPVILVTALDAAEERIKGLEAGADEFLTKPIQREELLARVRSLLRTEALHRTIRKQSTELANWNRKLEERVRDQLEELQRLSRLRNYFSPQVANMILADGNDSVLEPKRRSVTVVDIDLRGFTAFAEISEPEEVITVLREYHATMGAIVERHGGTIERFAGDGMMIFFNAPLDTDNHEMRAVRMAAEMQQAFQSLRDSWQKQGYDLGLGIGIARGYATAGTVGFSGRWDYAVIGTVTNVAARLCAAAPNGEIRVPQRYLARVQDICDATPIGEQTFHGLHQPIMVYNVTRVTPEDDAEAGPAEMASAG